MLINKLGEDFDEIVRSEGISKTEIGRMIGVSRQTINGLRHTDTLSKLLISVYDLLGYDVEITYIRRDK